MRPPPGPRTRKSRPSCTRAASASVVVPTVDEHERNRLALSVVAHATPATAMRALARAELALLGASIMDLVGVT